MRRAHEAGLTFSAGERVAEAEMVSWLGIFTDQALRITNSLKILVEQLITDAFNTKDVGALAAGAKQIGNAYRACLEWAARLRCASVPEDWREIVSAKSQMLDLFITELETFGTKLRMAIETAVENASDSDDPVLVDVTFSINVADMSSFYEALQRLRARRGLP